MALYRGAPNICFQRSRQIHIAAFWERTIYTDMQFNYPKLPIPTHFCINATMNEDARPYCILRGAAYATVLKSQGLRAYRAVTRRFIAFIALSQLASSHCHYYRGYLTKDFSRETRTAENQAPNDDWLTPSQDLPRMLLGACISNSLVSLMHKYLSSDQ